MNGRSLGFGRDNRRIQDKSNNVLEGVLTKVSKTDTQISLLAGIKTVLYTSNTKRSDVTLWLEILQSMKGLKPTGH